MHIRFEFWQTVLAAPGLLFGTARLSGTLSGAHSSRSDCLSKRSLLFSPFALAARTPEISFASCI